MEDFHQIIHGTRTCTFTLDGAIDPNFADEGTVTVNGTELEYGEDWVANSATEIDMERGSPRSSPPVTLNVVRRLSVHAP